MEDNTLTAVDCIRGAIQGTIEPTEAAGLLNRRRGELPAAIRQVVAEGGRDSTRTLGMIACAATGDVALAIADALGSVADSAAADALQEISLSAPSKEARKVARRALHHLASRRVRPADSRPAPTATSGPPQDRLFRTLASSIDGAGERMIWFAFRREPDVDFVAVLLGDEEGIKDTLVRDISERTFEREAAKLLEQTDFPWVELPPDYARQLVEAAHRLNAATGVSLPIEFLAWRDRISLPRTRFDQPIIYSVLSAAEVRWEPRYLDNSGGLLDLDVFRGWLLDKESLTPFIREKLGAERSGLVLAGITGESREALIEDRAIQALFDASRRSLYRRRLEEMAYVLWKVGRLEAARSTLAAALALEPTDRSLTGHPFVRELVRTSLNVATELALGESTRSVRPGLRLHLPY